MNPLLPNALSLFVEFKALKDAKSRIHPSEIFKHETDKYSQFDEQVSVLFQSVILLIFSWHARFRT